MVEAERFYIIFNTISEAIFLHEAGSGRIVDMNEAAIQMFGHGREAMADLQIADLSSGVPPYTQAEAMARLAEAHAGKVVRFEWQGRRRSGELFWADVTLRPARIGGADFLLAVVQDITERKRYQNEIEGNLETLRALNRKLEDAHLQLLQSEKMASIGQLAAGVAHEINNPVGFVLSNFGSLENYLRDFMALLDAYERSEPEMTPAAREAVRQLRQTLDIDYLKTDLPTLLAESREGVNRVRKIVQDLKDFSRVGAEDEWQWADVHAGLESTLNIVWNELKYKTTVVREYGTLPRIRCLPSQLNQVFMNLLVNAAQAIADKGTVTVRSGCAGDEVWVEVEDSGSGIPAENLSRIFDPFFTTKPVGKGTGLGLSVSYSIVRKHGGRIEVRSEVGKGSVFRVRLPVDPPPADGDGNPAGG